MFFSATKIWATHSRSKDEIPFITIRVGSITRQMFETWVTLVDCQGGGGLNLF